jgi:hypothetical protein
MRGRDIGAVLAGAALAQLALAYVWLAAGHGTPWLWNVVVHESGRYTLGETILYTTHFMREVPTVVAMALFLIAALHGSGLLPTRSRRGVSTWSLGLAFLLVGASFASAAAASGVASAFGDLAQFRTRDDLWSYGSHWRFHFLSTVWFAAAAAVVSRWAARSAARPPGSGTLDSQRLWTIAWLYFAGLTAVFGVSREIVADPRFVGHQAREILTHGPVTCLLVVGSALMMAREPSASVPPEPARPRALGRLAAVMFVLIPAALIILGMMGEVMAAGQTGQGLSAMVAAHAFEHTLDYVLVWLLVFGLGNRMGGRVTC